MTTQPFNPNRDHDGRFAESERAEGPVGNLVDATVVKKRLDAAYEIIDSGEVKPWSGGPVVDPVDAKTVRAGLRNHFGRLDDETFDKHVVPVLENLAKVNELNDETVDSIERWNHLREEAGVEFETSAAVTDYSSYDEPVGEDNLEIAYNDTYGVFEARLCSATEALEAADRSA